MQMNKGKTSKTQKNTSLVHTEDVYGKNIWTTRKILRTSMSAASAQSVRNTFLIFLPLISVKIFGYLCWNMASSPKKQMVETSSMTKLTLRIVNPARIELGFAVVSKKLAAPWAVNEMVALVKTLKRTQVVVRQSLRVDDCAAISRYRMRQRQALRIGLLWDLVSSTQHKKATDIHSTE